MTGVPGTVLHKCILNRIKGSKRLPGALGPGKEGNWSRRNTGRDRQSHQEVNLNRPEA